MNRENRKSGIGSSDASIIMEVNPWRTKMDLYMDKIGNGPEIPDNAAMARGREMEPIIRSMLEQSFGCLLVPKNIVHKSHDFVRASLDAVSFDSGIICEIKTASQEDHELARKGSVPKKYWPQLQHQLMCTGSESMHYASYNCKREELLTVLVKRDDEYVDTLFRKEEEFWNNHVIPRIPPSCTQSDLEDKSEDIAWLLTAESFIDARERMLAAESTLDKCRDNLAKLSKNKPCFGGGIRLSPQTAEGRVDYKSAFESILTEQKIKIQEDYLNRFKGKPIQKFRIDVTSDR